MCIQVRPHNHPISDAHSQCALLDTDHYALRRKLAKPLLAVRPVHLPLYAAGDSVHHHGDNDGSRNQEVLHGLLQGVWVLDMGSDLVLGCAFVYAWTQLVPLQQAARLLDVLWGAFCADELDLYFLFINYTGFSLDDEPDFWSEASARESQQK